MEKIWLKNYPKNVPAEINADAYTSLVTMFEQSCQQYHDKPALANLGKTLTYAELEKLSGLFATYLQQVLQLKKGDRVAIMLPNVLQYPVVLFGILRAGLIVVNTNPLYTPDELAHQLKDAGAVAIIVLANFAQSLTQALTKTSIQHVIVTEIGDLLGWKGPLINFAVKYIKQMVPAWAIQNAVSLKQALCIGKEHTFKPVALTGEDVAFLQYTGGTTGVTKGAVLTHRNMIANVMQCYAWIDDEVRMGQEVVIIALPLYHIFSLTICCLAFIRFGGLGLLITNPRDIPGFVKELTKVPFSVFVGVNTLYNALLNNPKFSQLNFSHLRISVAGGMAMQHSVADKWQQLTGKRILEGYGLTEASPVVTINPTNITHFTGSIGMPIPSTDVRICDEAGVEVPLNEEGEMYVKGPQVMRGYWQKPEETQLVLTEDGWLKTGDMVRMDQQGLLYMVDRKKDMIIVSGFNVYPNEVEDVIAAHPGVLEVGVVGVPSDRSGEMVKAFVVKKDPNLTEQQLIDYCHQHLTRYKVPKVIEFADSLPKSNVGKILRRKLREMGINHNHS